MQTKNRSIVILIIVFSLVIVACGETEEPSKVEPVEVEPIDGSDLSRVTLTTRAAERLDIQVDQIIEDTITRMRSVGGQIVTERNNADEDLEDVRVRVSLNVDELEEIDLDEPVIISPLDGGESEVFLADTNSSIPEELTGSFIESATDNSSEEVQKVLYFRIDSAEYDLPPGLRVQVQLKMVNSGSERLILPYSALLYDTNGDTWAYTTDSESLTFVREPVTVDYIDGDRVILLDGPPAGTRVAIIGVAELYGAEVGVGK